MLARSYGYQGPFDKKLIFDLRQPYRRALLLNSLEIKSLSEMALTEGLPETILTATDAIGVPYFNSKSKRKIKTLFVRKKKAKDNFMTVPDGKGGTRKIRMM
jgi:hypothetical protein